MNRLARQGTALMITGMLVVLVGCSAGDVAGTDGRDPTEPSSASPVQQVPPDVGEETPSAVEDRYDERLPDPLLDPDDIISGGPPPDGIPAIDEPTFETADQVEWLDDEEPVLALTVGEETRAYPLRVMTWHEIVNDTVGEVPVAVTYCPLCNSGVAFERQVDGRVLTFGTSGMLYADNLVMYDRQTESLWPQLTGQAAIGVLTGTQLTAIPMGVVAWGDFRDASPDSLVLSRDTGFDRPYGQNPYVGYDNPDGELLFELPGRPDARLPVKERVVGISHGGSSVAVVRDSLAEASLLEVTVGERELVLMHKPGQTSALDAHTISGGTDIGTVAVYVPVVDGRRLHFQAAGGEGFRDRETRSRWNILGHATHGPLKGTQLRPYRHLDTFWFAWVTFHPDTELLDRGDGTQHPGSAGRVVHQPGLLQRHPGRTSSRAS